MARRRTPIDAVLDSFLALSPEDRPFAMAALNGANRALKTRGAPATAEVEAAEELGESAVDEGGR